jgi:hypothetical protein
MQNVSGSHGQSPPSGVVDEVAEGRRLVSMAALLRMHGDDGLGPDWEQFDEEAKAWLTKLSMAERGR